jgi:hypothetical protein
MPPGFKNINTTLYIHENEFADYILQMSESLTVAIIQLSIYLHPDYQSSEQDNSS